MEVALCYQSVWPHCSPDALSSKPHKGRHSGEQLESSKEPKSLLCTERHLRNAAVTLSSWLNKTTAFISL